MTNSAQWGRVGEKRKRKEDKRMKVGGKEIWERKIGGRELRERE